MGAGWAGSYDLVCRSAISTVNGYRLWHRLVKAGAGCIVPGLAVV
jgi:hypothetical protein